MKDGDVAGLAASRDSSAWIGVEKANGAYKLALVNNLTLDADWNTSSSGILSGLPLRDIQLRHVGPWRVHQRGFVPVDDALSYLGQIRFFAAGSVRCEPVHKPFLIRSVLATTF
jgi:hypothetical protein